MFLPLSRSPSRPTTTIGNLEYSINGEGDRTDYHYDLLNRVLLVELPQDGSGYRQENASVYDTMGNLLQATVTPPGADARTNSYVYDEMRRTEKSVNVDGTCTLSQYDAIGNLVAQTDALGRVTRFRYDERGRLIATIRPDGSSVRTVYDGGRVSRVIDAMGNVTEYEYDEMGRKSAVTLADPDGDDGPLGTSTTTYHYDPYGNLQYVVDPLGSDTTDTEHVTEYVYDAAGHLKEVIESSTVVTGLGATTSYLPFSHTPSPKP